MIYGDNFLFNMSVIHLALLHQVHHIFKAEVSDTFQKMFPGGFSLSAVNYLASHLEKLILLLLWVFSDTFTENLKEILKIICSTYAHIHTLSFKISLN